MTIDKKTIDDVARLARLTIDSNDTHWAQNLTAIFEWIAQLEQVNTDGVEPLYSMADHTLQAEPDERSDGGCRDAVLKESPQQSDGFFIVPTVIERSD
ncbi:MAG: Asp-tRNA(Asn)/Glu-tRNA(Gln) amidotransferase subunit GatC [Alphaproteobacteria bacterium GM202ARS2]|nr:Asp-tRNA(Asn)/Glu-tRNA(Gln) amidotransferase subunit GatC [Alphaproteobacteria bacterium GM202ARS2]